MVDDTTESVTDGPTRSATGIQINESGATSETARIDSETVVEAHGIKKDFDGDGEDGGVLQGIDLDVRRGETTVLMGPNGVGKTVLLACLAGGLHPSSGEIRVFDEPPDDASSRLCFMLQNALAVGELTGRENLEYYADLHPQASDEWQEIAERLDLAADLDRRVRDYSGGMVRKLELAATLSVDVPLYLLDEPTGELDLTTVEDFHALLNERIERGTTVVMTSHMPRDARTADRVVFMADGRIVAAGDPDALLDSVPPVVGTTAHADAGAIRERLQSERLFEDDAGRRGFLAEKVDPTTIADPDNGIQIKEPTWTDLFNYYVHIAPWRGVDDS